MKKNNNKNSLINNKNITIKKIVPKKKKKKFNPLNFLSLRYIATQMVIPETKWIVRDLLPEGLTLLAGKPKRGKSFFALNMAIKIAQGFKFMHKFYCEKNTVYYLPYEDPFIRIKKRTLKMLGGMKVPLNLLISNKPTEFPRLNEGGLEALKKIIKKRRDIGVIIIDTLGRFIKKTNYGNLNFSEDYDLLGQLQSLATKYHISILLVHHTTKKTSEDPFDEIQGTMGNQASPDSLLLMRKVNGFIELRAKGRDFEEKEYSIQFDKNKYTWELKGNLLENGLSKSVMKILSLLKKFPNKSFTVNTIFKFIKDTSVQNTQNKLKRLVDKGLIEKTSRGYYKINKLTYTGLLKDTKF